MKIVFPFLVVISYVFLALETYSYIGFLKKYILVDSRVVLVLALFSVFFLKLSKNKGNNFWETLDGFVFKVNRLLFPIFVFTYLVMQTFEAFKYHNYVFSTVHLRPENFIYILVLSGGLFVLEKFKGVIDFKKNTFKYAIYLVLLFAFIDGSAVTINQAVASDMHILFHPRASYEKKMEDYWGFFYKYLTFVKNNTEENSTILIPPQESPWLSTGNTSLVRYFLYPRNIIQGAKNDLSNVKSSDYVFIAWGEWMDSDATKYGWPKVDINAEKVLYFEEKKNDIKVVNSNFKAGSANNFGGWGIIKVKK